MSRLFSNLLNIRLHVTFLYFSVFILIAKITENGLTFSELETGLLFFVLIQLAYLLNKFADYEEDLENKEAIPFLINVPGIKYKTGFVIIVLVFYLTVKRPQLFPIFIFGTISILPYSDSNLKFKSLFLIKPLINTLGFFLMAVMTPLLLSDPLAYEYAGIVFAKSIELVAIVFCITIMFDIRDIHGDIKAGFKTVPIVFGKTATLLLLVGIILFFCISNFKKGAAFAFANNLIVLGFILGGFKAKGNIYFSILVLIEILFVWVFIWLK